MIIRWQTVRIIVHALCNSPRTDNPPVAIVQLHSEKHRQEELFTRSYTVSRSFQPLPEQGTRCTSLVA